MSVDIRTTQWTCQQNFARSDAGGRGVSGESGTPPRTPYRLYASRKMTRSPTVRRNVATPSQSSVTRMRRLRRDEPNAASPQAARVREREAPDVDLGVERAGRGPREVQPRRPDHERVHAPPAHRERPDAAGDRARRVVEAEPRAARVRHELGYRHRRLEERATAVGQLHGDAGAGEPECGERRRDPSAEHQPVAARAEAREDQAAEVEGPRALDHVRMRARRHVEEDAA